MNVIPPIEINDARFVSSTVPENDHPVWNGTSTYNQGDRVIVTTPDVHTIFESARDGNTNVNPVGAAETDWIDLGATNRWKMFDELNGTQTTAQNTLTTTVRPGQRFNTVALLNVDAATARIRVIDPTDGVVYDQTRNLQSTSGITDWYAYYTTPIQRERDEIFLDLPAYPNADVELTLSESSAEIGIGVFVVGDMFSVGDTDHGTSTGIIDYSTKTTDQFGNFIITRRAFSERADFLITCQTSRTAAIQNFLSSIRTTPVVWIGHPDFGATIIYGYYRDFDILLSDPQVSQCNIIVEGLT